MGKDPFIYINLSLIAFLEFLDKNSLGMQQCITIELNATYWAINILQLPLFLILVIYC